MIIEVPESCPASSMDHRDQQLTGLVAVNEHQSESSAMPIDEPPVLRISLFLRHAAPAK